MSKILISDEELKSLTQAILRRYGIDFTGYESLSFKRRISHAINYFGLESIHGLWIKLLKERDFIQPFIDAITVGLTAMFRDPVLWKSLKMELKQLASEKGRLNIWHAGCSTGEEVYSMAILLHEIGLSEITKINATDINEGAIEHAKKGIYNKHKIAEYDKNYRKFNPFGQLKRYYQTTDEGAKMDPDLLKNVTFRNHNLITEPILTSYDLIFCRNVMIYFDDTSKIGLMRKFHEKLADDGLLIVGFYDSIISLLTETNFALHNSQAKLYKKQTVTV